MLRLEEALSDALGMTAHVQTNKQGRGKLTLHFGSADELAGFAATSGHPAVRTCAISGGRRSLAMRHHYIVKFIIKLLDDCIDHANSSIIAG